MSTTELLLEKFINRDGHRPFSLPPLKQYVKHNISGTSSGASSGASDDPHSLFRSANALKSAGKIDQAEKLYRQLLKMAPNHPEISLNYGNLLQDENRFSDAITVYQNALSKDNGHTLLLNGLGNTYCKMGALSKALPLLKRATVANPNDAVSWFNLANVYFQCERVERAQKTLNRAKTIEPRQELFFHLAGEIEEQTDQWDTAIQTYQLALELNPNNPITLHKLGRCYYETQNYELAIDALRQCLKQDDQYGLAWYHLGNSYSAIGQHALARQSYEKSLAINPDHHASELNLALNQLKTEHWQSGWRHYEIRWTMAPYNQSIYPIPLPKWQGEHLNNKGIVLWGEQGIGDEMMFVRVARYLQTQAKKVTVFCNPRLTTLLKSSLPGVEVIAKVSDINQMSLPESVHYQCPLASAFQYLPDRVISTPFQLLPDSKNPPSICFPPLSSGKRKIGISWHTKNTTFGHFRSIPLQHWLPLLSDQQHFWVNAQAGKHQKSLQLLSKKKVPLYRSSQINPMGELNDFAHLLSQLDLVITIDNSTAHIAANLGIPTWVLLSHKAEWRWGVKEKTCPWYKSVKLYRAQKDNDWGPVFELLAHDLQDYFADPSEQG